MLAAEIGRVRSGAKRLKLRTLLGRFGYNRRTDANTSEITAALNAMGIGVNPPIVRLGDTWEVSPEDWIYLSCDAPGLASPPPKAPAKPPEWRPDEWFERVARMELRTEKEVEIKFIVPLLARLGYTDDDRYDGMPVPAAHGSRDTTLVIDFALFNSTVEELRNQPLLTVEAKRENRLARARELLSAHNQAKSYCLWTQCDFFMVTDSRTVQAYHVARGRMGEVAPLFSCERNELRERFAELHALVSREVLTRHYLARLARVDEM